MRWLSLALAAAGALYAPPLLAADGDDDGTDRPDRQAIQRRKYELNHELRIALGTLPIDPYEKGWSASLSYTYHFNDYVAWEIVQLTGALHTDTDLREQVLLINPEAEDDFASPRLLATSGIEITPLYGKFTLLNSLVVHQQLFVGVYAGVAFGNRRDLSETFEDARPLVGLGIGTRVFLSQVVSLRIDIRDFASFRRAFRENESFEVENVLFMTLSASFAFGGDGT